MGATDKIKIEKLEPPFEDPGLFRLLWHKGDPWIGDIGNRIQGKYADSRDRFFVARAGRELVGHAWYTVAASDPRVGLLGHVYTRPDYRRQHISTRLLQAAMADFTSQGGVISQLYTSTPEILACYEGLGFENLFGCPVIHETDWSMRFPFGAQKILETWLAPAACTIRPLAPGDMPKYGLLYNLEFRTRLKDWAQGIGTGLECEFTFLNTLNRLAAGQGACCVLDNGQAIVGIASLMTGTFAHQSHIGRLDCYVYGDFKAKTKELVDFCLAQRKTLGVEHLYALAVDEDKKRNFSSLGFQAQTVLKAHYKIKDQRLDCTVYQWEPVKRPPAERLRPKPAIPYA